MWMFLLGIVVAIGVFLPIAFVSFHFYRFVNRREWFEEGAPWLVNDDEIREQLFWKLFFEQFQRAAEPKIGGKWRRRISFSVALVLGFSLWGFISILRWIARRNQPGDDRHFSPIVVKVTAEPFSCVKQESDAA